MLHSAECGIDLAFVMTVPNQVKPLRWGSFHVNIRPLLDTSKRSCSSQIHNVNQLNGSVLQKESPVVCESVRACALVTPRAACLLSWVCVYARCPGLDYVHMLDVADLKNVSVFVRVLQFSGLANQTWQPESLTLPNLTLRNSALLVCVAHIGVDRKKYRHILRICWTQSFIYSSSFTLLMSPGKYARIALIVLPNPFKRNHNCCLECVHWQCCFSSKRGSFLLQPKLFEGG